MSTASEINDRIRRAQAEEWLRLGFCGSVVHALQSARMEHIGDDADNRGNQLFRMPRGELEYITLSLDPDCTENDILIAIYHAGRRDLRHELRDLRRKMDSLIGK